MKNTLLQEALLLEEVRDLLYTIEGKQYPVYIKRLAKDGRKYHRPVYFTYSERNKMFFKITRAACISK